MADGNKLLKHWAFSALGNRKKQHFRKLLFSGHIKPGLRLGKIEQVFPQTDFDAIMRVKEIEWEMMRGFAPLITLRTSVWVERVSGQDRHQLFADLYQEAHMAFSEAHYGYIGGVEFITYLWWAIERRLRREIENMKLPMVPPSAENARKLVQGYEQYRANCPVPITFDEYVIQAELNLDEAHILAKALSTVISETDFKTMSRTSAGFGRWGEHHWDLTSFDCELEDANVSETVATKELHEAIQKCVEMANLTDFQRDLLIGCQTPFHGWKAEVAKRHGKSRTRAGQLLNETLAQLRVLYEAMKDEESFNQ